MNEARKCPKCDGRMAIAEEKVLGSFFGCTRNPKFIQALKGEKIESYLCQNCGYIEFYKKKKE